MSLRSERQLVHEPAVAVDARSSLPAGTLRVLGAEVRVEPRQFAHVGPHESDRSHSRNERLLPPDMPVHTMFDYTDRPQMNMRPDDRSKMTLRSQSRAIACGGYDYDRPLLECDSQDSTIDWWGQEAATAIKDATTRGADQLSRKIQEKSSAHELYSAALGVKKYQFMEGGCSVFDKLGTPLVHVEMETAITLSQEVMQLGKKSSTCSRPVFMLAFYVDETGAPSLRFALKRTSDKTREFLDVSLSRLELHRKKLIEDKFRATTRNRWFAADTTQEAIRIVKRIQNIAAILEKIYLSQWTATDSKHRYDQ
jgi:hypothetical protein